MTDNFKLFEEYIYNSTPNRGRKINDDPDKYWVVEIIKRRKDHDGTTGNNIHFKNYYITKISELYRYEQEIKKLCDTFGFRAYISVNYKSYEQVTKDTCVAYAERIAKNEYGKPYRLWKSCSGKYLDPSNKRWILDFDEKDLDFDTIENILRGCKPEGSKVLAKFPTKSGLHFITTPFDVNEFREKWDSNMQSKQFPDIKKNHLTLLYENLDNN